MKRLIRLGMEGEDIAYWQAFLRGFNPYSEVIITGKFDEQTHAETKEFQNVFDLMDDGCVGNKTIAKALENDFFTFDRVDKEEVTEFSHTWPARPDFGPLGYQDRLRIFGQFSYRHTPIKGMQEHVRITDNWQAENICWFEIPQLIDVVGGPTNGKVLLHKLAGSQIVKTFQDWEDAGMKDKVISWAGSFVPRFIRGSHTTLSNHAHGTAFDINAPWNGLGRQPALKGKPGSVRELVEIANDNGLFWGGHFSRPDGMHFEVARAL